MPTDASSPLWREGGCHCGAVRFAVRLPEAITAQECNCSICAMTGFLHIIVPDKQFRMVSGKKNLTEYRFNTGVARHLFCKTCGVKPFYVPRSNPNGWSVNLRCLEQSEFAAITIEPFDGRHWEDHAAALAHLT